MHTNEVPQNFRYARNNGRIARERCKIRPSRHRVSALYRHYETRLPLGAARSTSILPVGFEMKSGMRFPTIRHYQMAGCGRTRWGRSYVCRSNRLLRLLRRCPAIEALAQEDEQFRSEHIAAVEARDTDKVVAFLASKGFEATAEKLRDQVENGLEIDEAELQAVAGGANRYEKLDEYSGGAGSFMFGLGLASALWCPSFKDDQ